MKKLVFDFDGTLVDSMKIWGSSATNVLDDNKVSYPADIVKTLTPLGYIGSAKYFREHLGMTKSVDEIFSEIIAYAVRSYSNDIIAKEFVRDTLTTLREEGYSLNVLTASPHILLDVCLKRNELYDLFDNVWSCDDFFTTKGDPKIYHMVAKKLGTTVDGCAFFDDNINAVTCAKGAGMTVIGVYDDSSDDDTDKIKEISDGYIKDFSELKLVKNLLV